MMSNVRIKINNVILELTIGDITQEATDAIVNAANSSLLGGGGVDGAIHRAAGPDLLNETRQMGGCNTGDAKISGGYRLKAKHLIHTVGPVYSSTDPNIPKLLASAYRRSLEVAVENGIKTIAFPAISTGVYGYPLDKAALVSLETIITFLSENHQIELVRIVLFDQNAFQYFRKALENLVK